MPNRYDRQQPIPGWHQENLTNARVFVVGSGYLAQLIAGRSGESRTSALARLLSKINPEINTGFYNLPVLYEECLQAYATPCVNVIVEAGHDAGSNSMTPLVNTRPKHSWKSCAESSPISSMRPS